MLRDREIDVRRHRLFELALPRGDGSMFAHAATLGGFPLPNASVLLAAMLAATERAPALPLARWCEDCTATIAWARRPPCVVSCELLGLLFPPPCCAGAMNSAGAEQLHIALFCRVVVRDVLDAFQTFEILNPIIRRIVILVVDVVTHRDRTPVLLLPYPAGAIDNLWGEPGTAEEVSTIGLLALSEGLKSNGLSPKR